MFFFKGSQNYPTSADITTPIDAIGGDFNAFTSKEHTEYYIKAEKHHFDLVFDLLTDMILNPLFEEKELEKEKGVVIEEINMYDDNPSSVAESNLERILWPDSALGTDVIGSKQTVTDLTRAAVFKYKEKFYQPSNIILGISGNFDQDKALDKISRTWGMQKNIAVPKLGKLVEKQSKPSTHIEFKKTQQAHLALGFRSFAHEDKNNYATALLANILGGNMSSRLFTTIREQKGLAYYVNAWNMPYYHTGIFAVQSGVKIESAKEALIEILAALRKVKSDLVSEQELQRAKDYFKGKMALANENSHRRLDWVLEAFATSGQIKTFEELYQKLDAVTILDIQKVANKIFQDDRMCLSVVGPFKNTRDFQKELYFKDNYIG